MKKLSIHKLALTARESLIRFPLVILSAFIGTLAGVYLVEVSEVTQDVFPFINVMLCGALGIPLYFSVQVLVEKKALGRRYVIILPFVATLVLVLIYLSLPNEDSTHNTFQPYVRYVIYNVCLHLLVSFLPFVSIKPVDSFWNYNISLLLRILTSIVYSMVLYVGVVLALLALHLLFDLDFDGKIYLQLFILMIGLFNTWFFLSGIPRRLNQLEGTPPPKELKAFAQYVLLPLLAVYLLILYGYGAKIVLIWDWPRGIVSYLIICVAVLGIATFLLLYPYRRLEGNNWIKKSTLAFYGLLIPLLLLLFIAVNMRLEDYGFTVNRYLIFVLGIWLVMSCLYFLFGKGNIKFIPISLSALFFLVSFGPWGVFKVSENSQVERLRRILSEADLLVEDKIKGEVIWDEGNLPSIESPGKSENRALLTDSLYWEVSSILHYLEDYHGFKSIQPWFSQDMEQILAEINKDKLKWQRMREVQLYMRAMGLNDGGPGSSSPGFFSIQADLRQATTDVKGYNHLIQFSINESEAKEFVINGTIYQLQLDKSGSGLVLSSDQEVVSIPLEALLEKLLDDSQEQDQGFHTVPQSKLLYEGQEMGGFRLLMHYINYERTGAEKGDLKLLSGFLLLRGDPKAP